MTSKMKKKKNIDKKQHNPKIDFMETVFVKLRTVSEISIYFSHASGTDLKLVLYYV